MRKAALLSLICFTALMHAEAPPAEKGVDSQWCNDLPKSLRVTTRHIENKGIGYNTGYTTLETFLAAPPDKWCVMPFLDLRGHLFNDGKWAANGGVGLRNIMGSRVYGLYTYYDYRDARKDSYNQISFGLETLGTFWDARLNGYVVLGSQKSKSYGAKFAKFSGNSLYYNTRFEYALSGANGEVGFHPIKMKNVDVYTAIGPYYLKGPSQGCVWGIETRAMASWKDYITAEISYSYDHMFSNIVQGQVSFSYPFGPTSKVKPSHGRSCKDNKLLYRRMVQPVMKEEIIPVHTKRQTKKAINPETGDPWVFWFVDNTSHSSGTFESPFPTLLLAQNASAPNQAIYVFPGNGSTTGMDGGILLQNGQLLLGASVAHSIPTTAGVLSIPAMASAAPNITNIGSDVVSLASHNVVSGFNITATGIHTACISGSNIANLIATQNTLDASVILGHGILLTDCSGSAFIENNTFTGGRSAFYAKHSYLDNINITSCLFGDSLFGIFVDYANTLNITRNFFNNITNESVDIELLVGTVNAIGNSFTNCNTGIHNFGTIGTLNVFENAFSYLNFEAIVCVFGSTDFLNAVGNTFDHATAGIFNNGSIIGTINASNNTFDNLNSGIFSAGTTGSLYTKNNIFTDISGSCIITNTNLPLLYVVDSTFNGVSNPGQGISYTAPANENAIATILNNTFVPGNSPSPGYATDITVNQAASTLCLRLTGNIAPPQSQTGAAAYSFNESGGDAFNLTLGSTSTLNSGGFIYSGLINSPGSCRQ